MSIETPIPICACAAGRVSIGTIIKVAANRLRNAERRDMVISPLYRGPKTTNISPSAQTPWAYSVKPRIAIFVAN